QLYRETNIPLQAELKQLESSYGAIIGAMTIEHQGEELTMPQAAQLLKTPDRNLRENIFSKMTNRRRQEEDKLDVLMSKLIDLRHQIAVNAGFETYTQYRFVELGRFDY